MKFVIMNKDGAYLCNLPGVCEHDICLCQPVIKKEDWNAHMMSCFECSGIGKQRLAKQRGRRSIGKGKNRHEMQRKVSAMQSIAVIGIGSASP